MTKYLLYCSNPISILPTGMFGKKAHHNVLIDENLECAFYIIACEEHFVAFLFARASIKFKIVLF